jgi:hypothetical protein
MGFVVEKVTLGQIFIKLFDTSIIPQMLNTRLQGCSRKVPQTIIIVIIIVLVVVVSK